jgi:PTH2 family peptidyl-tRNA hydrolase
MPSGKMAAQAGHAFLEAFLASPEVLALAYRSESVGTKVTLEGSLLRILKAQARCERDGIPHALIRDSGHVYPPHFDGSPIVTALGVGLSPRSESITKKFNLYRRVS